MRELSQDLQQHLASGATTLCRVFVLELADGRRFAFSDHDRPILFGGLAVRPMEAAETERRAGFDTDSGAMRCVFDVDLPREDLMSGALDGARLAEHRVNWAAPEQSVHVTTGRIGAVSVTESGFEADWLGLSTLLDRSTGRVVSRRCDAEYGDARCGLVAEDGQSCSRTLEACRGFDNVLNYRGFPYLLGDDVLQKGVHLTPTRDGGSRYDA
ncbi:MAG: DUF2163 domain-containing protein [Pseudomonadota bacterium]